MCGVFGYFSEQKPLSEEAVNRALKALQHRGPDNQGSQFSAGRQAVVAHTRLSMVDLIGGDQPLLSADGQVLVAVNGELYDYSGLRRQLVKEGATFTSNSDSELALHLYWRYGLDFVHHLRGEFAIVIWDERSQQLIAVRDRFGIKPLCFSTIGGVAVASEAKALFAAGILKPEWDEESLFAAYSCQYTPLDKTVFKNVYQLKPGHMLIASGHNYHTQSYWDINYSGDAADIEDEDAIGEFRTLFEQAVEQRLSADVPLCVHLSGGLDSTAVAALAARDRTVDCFSVSFDQPGYDECEYAGRTASFLNVNHHVVELQQIDLLVNLEEAVFHSEGLGINGHYTGKFLLNQAIKKNGFKGALTGEGADELLAGYPHLRQDLYAGNEQYLQSLQEQNIASSGVMMGTGQESLSLTEVERQLGYIPGFIKAKAGMGFRLHQVLSRDFYQKNNRRDCWAEFVQQAVSPAFSEWSQVNKSLYLWNKSCLPVYILRTLGDGCEMAHSIEGRLPFLDHKLFEFCQQLPLELKICHGVEKYILREAVKDIIPGEIYSRQKHPFIAPPLLADRKAKEFIFDLFSSDLFRDLPFFNYESINVRIKHLVDADAAEQKIWDPIIYTLLTTAFIHKRLMGGGYV